MLVLKLRRTGKKHQPSFRLVVAERRSKSTGKYLESLGWYNPRNKEHQFNKERVQHWLAHGAQKTNTVHNLLIKTGVLSGNKIPVHKVVTKTAVNNSGDQPVNKVEQKSV